MKNRVPQLLHMLFLVLFLFAYFWSDRHALEVQGPTRMVLGPDNTIIMLVDKQIIKVSSDGEVLSTLNLEDIGVSGLVSDLFVEPNGEMLIGLMEPQKILRYSSDGKKLGTHARLPSPVISNELQFKFTKDSRSGLLYVADSGLHRIQIYGPDEKEMKVLDSHGTPIPQNNDLDKGETDKTNPHQNTPDIPLHFPNGLAIYNDQLYVTDTHNHQIIVFDLNGSFKKAMSTISNRWTENIYPIRVSLSNNTLYVINRGPNYLGGEVSVISLDGTEAKQFYPSHSFIDPLDILAREDDVLIADDNSKEILSYLPEGIYRGYFGKASLRAIFSEKKNHEVFYKIVRMYSMACMLGVLVSLLFLKRKDRQTREELGLPSEHQPVRALQEILGPEGSRRRDLLLVLVPGFGYAAAGRALRAIILLPILLLCIVFFVTCIVGYILDGVIFLWPVIATGLVTAVAWTGIVLDGKRLNEKVERSPHKIDPLNIIVTVAIPFITVASGAATQLLREKFNHANPELALVIQELLYKLMLSLHFIDKPSVILTAFQPASLILGWGGATAGLFGALAWKFHQGTRKITQLAVIGFVFGMVSWILTATFPGTMLGSAYYLPLSQGVLVSVSVFLLFRREIGSMLIIPAGIVGAWIGGILHLFFRFPLPFVNPGASIRTTSVVFQAYFLHLAILLAMNALERRKQKTAASEAAPV